MEMSEILDRAKELATRYEANGYIHRDATLLLPNLVAECEFWQQRAIEERAKRIANVCESERIGVWSRLEKIVYEEAEIQLEAMR